jgi:hypothetical protein
MGTPLKILLIEDSEYEAGLLIREMKRGGYDPIHERVETAEAMNATVFISARSELALEYYSIVASDYRRNNLAKCGLWTRNLHKV